jgi:hypothetical protein
MKYSLDELKKQPYFKLGDIIIYVVILITVVTLLCVFLIPNTNRTLEKVNIYYDDTLIYVYDFDKNEGEIVKGYENYIVEQKDTEKTLVRIKTNDGENFLEIGKDNAVMAKSDCSHFADCVKSFRPIKEGGDVIICLPNKIRIIGEGKILSNEVRL